MSYDFELSCILPASPGEIYDAWLDSAAHSAMTESEASMGRNVGDAFTAWDGYIEGEILELIPGKRIVQSWRTSEFGLNDRDSRVIVDLEPTSAGTRLTLTHSGVPDGQTSYQNGGWQDFYFAPMKAYFAREKKKTGKGSETPAEREP